MFTDNSRIAMAGVVFMHFVVTLAHGAAHTGASVSLGPAALAFVVVVIEIGPFAGLAYARRRPIAGALIVAATMSAALVFGLVNHFLVHGQDHVSHVAGQWRPLFGLTAALLVLTEAAGVAAGIWAGSRAFRRAR
jgi:hypothetical protein